LEEIAVIVILPISLSVASKQLPLIEQPPIIKVISPRFPPPQLQPLAIIPGPTGEIKFWCPAIDNSVPDKLT
jgi:hypothetical protein